jgi:hypothetical protein
MCFFGKPLDLKNGPMTPMNWHRFDFALDGRY